MRPITITDLGSLGGASITAAAVNDRGQVVGSGETPDGSTHAFLWQDGVMRDLGTLGGAHSNAFFVNSRGQVVGQSATVGDSDFVVFVWRDGVMRTLTGPGWLPTRITASAMSERGVVAGYGISPSGFTRAFTWYRSVLTELPGLAPETHDNALDVNERGQATGTAGRADGGTEPVIWARSRVRALGTLGGAHGWGSVINDRGHVAGISSTAENANRAFLWRRGVMTDLGVDPGAADQYVWDLNNRDQVLVESRTGVDSRFFVRRNGTVTELTGLLPDRYLDARDLNNRGQVVGWTYAADGRAHAVMWHV